MTCQKPYPGLIMKINEMSKDPPAGFGDGKEVYFVKFCLD